MSSPGFGFAGLKVNQGKGASSVIVSRNPSVAPKTQNERSTTIKTVYSPVWLHLFVNIVTLQSTYLLKKTSLTKKLKGRIGLPITARYGKSTFGYCIFVHFYHFGKVF